MPQIWYALHCNALTSDVAPNVNIIWLTAISKLGQRLSTYSVGDSLIMRQKLFARVPNAETTWRQLREEYAANIQPLADAGQLVMARKYALRALQFLPESHPQASFPPPRFASLVLQHLLLVLTAFILSF